MNSLIRNVRLIDGTGADPVPSTNIAVENGVITWIGEGTVSPLKHPHFEDISAEDLTLVPGTFDCHEHFAGDGGQYGGRAMNTDPPEVLLRKAAANARLVLMTGQTSARDVGSPYGISITLAQAVAAGALPGPRITASGEWLQFPTTWLHSKSPTRTVYTLEEMEKAILSRIAQGAGLIKVGATGQDMPDDIAERGTMGLEIAKKVVEFVHAHGLKIAAHCTGYAGTSEFVAAGGDSVEHGTHIDEETAKLMAENGVILVPTLAWRDYVFRASKRHGMPKERVDANEAIRESHRASFQRCIAAGVKIAAGTDAGGGDPMRHGNIVREMEVMVECGLTPMQAIEGATRIAAELVGTLDDVGTIEVGKQADFILVDGDPLSDVRDLRNVWAVYQGGRRIR
jgi:imidazolonepropionase-like amidohydrolase